MHECLSGADVEVVKWPDTWQPRSQQMRSGKAVDADLHWQMQEVSEHVAKLAISGSTKVCICMALHAQTEFTRPRACGTCQL